MAMAGREVAHGATARDIHRLKLSTAVGRDDGKIIDTCRVANQQPRTGV